MPEHGSDWLVDVGRRQHRSSRCRPYVVGRCWSYRGAGGRRSRGARSGVRGREIVEKNRTPTVLRLPTAPPHWPPAARKSLQNDLRHTTYGPSPLEARSRSRSRRDPLRPLRTSILRAYVRIPDGSNRRPQRPVLRAGSSVAAPEGRIRPADSLARSAPGGVGHPSRVVSMRRIWSPVKREVRSWAATNRPPACSSPAYWTISVAWANTQCRMTNPIARAARPGRTAPQASRGGR